MICDRLTGFPPRALPHALVALQKLSANLSVDILLPKIEGRRTLLQNLASLVALQSALIYRSPVGLIASTLFAKMFAFVIPAAKRTKVKLNLVARSFYRR